MALIGLLETLTSGNSILSGFDEKHNRITAPDHRHHYYSPGCLVLLAAFAKEKRISEGNIHFSKEEHYRYAEAIGLQSAIWGNDTYTRKRINHGINYSQLVHLETEQATDNASGAINSCIREFFNPGEHDQFVNELCDLIGDLHSNVWAHGKASGFSMAQKNKIPYVDAEYSLEFAIADHGIGFLNELARVGLAIDNDQDAINWCIQKGNSTKKITSGNDDWAQSMPADIISSPLRGIEKTRISDGNHHQGYGLFKLTELVKKFSGELTISSGHKLFLLDGNGKESYKDSVHYWQGVAISCKFDTRFIGKATQSASTEGADRVLGLMRKS